MKKWTLRARMSLGLSLLVLCVAAPGACVSFNWVSAPFLPFVFAGAAIFAAGVATALFFTATRSLGACVVSLNANSAEIATASLQVAEANNGSAEGASRQAATLEETSSSLEEVASMTRRNSDHAQQANALAKETHAAADRGLCDIQAIGDAIDALNGSSTQIATILKTIDDIAFQTNILALNASVEAALAGSAGAGFSVVADEVRTLAKRTTEASHETATKIDEVVCWISQCQILKVEVLSALNDIAEKAKKMDDLVTEVADASRQQVEALAQVNLAVGDLSQTTQSNAASTEECAAAAAELQSRSQLMRVSMNELIYLLGGLDKMAAKTKVVAAGKNVDEKPRQVLAHALS